MQGISLKYKSEERLHLSKGPSIKSWSILFGLLSLGCGVAFYGSDAVVIKVIYILGSTIIGLTCLEEWEDCVMDRYLNKATLTRANWYNKLCCRVPDESTTVLTLSSIMGIKVTSNKKPHGFLKGNAYSINLILNSGLSVPITEGDCGNCKGDMIQLANQIHSFLRLSHIEAVEDSDYYYFHVIKDNGHSETDSSMEDDDYAEANSSEEDYEREREYRSWSFSGMRETVKNLSPEEIALEDS